MISFTEVDHQAQRHVLRFPGNGIYYNVLRSRTAHGHGRPI